MAKPISQFSSLGTREELYAIEDLVVNINVIKTIDRTTLLELMDVLSKRRKHIGEAYA
jgi:hypothetical protein